MRNNVDLTRITSIISRSQPLATEKTEEQSADLSPTEIECLKAKEELRTAHLQNDILEETLAKLKQNRGERKDYASMIFNFMSCYMIAVFVIIIMNGITINHFHLSDSVILALLGTTAVEIIGTFSLVPKYLFDNKS